MKFYQTMNGYNLVSYPSIQDALKDHPNHADYKYSAPLLNYLSLLPADEEAITAIAEMTTLDDSDEGVLKATIGIEFRELEVISTMIMMSKGTGKDIDYVDLRGNRIFNHKGKHSSPSDVGRDINDIMGIDFSKNDGVIPMRENIEVIGSYRESFIIDKTQSMESLSELKSRKMKKATMAHVGGEYMDNYGSDSIEDDTCTHSPYFDLSYIGDFETAIKFKESCDAITLANRAKAVELGDTCYIACSSGLSGLNNCLENPLIVKKTSHGLSIQSNLNYAETYERKDNGELENIMWLNDEGMNHLGAIDPKHIYVCIQDMENGTHENMVLDKGKAYSIKTLEPLDPTLYKKHQLDFDLDCMF